MAGEVMLPIRRRWDMALQLRLFGNRRFWVGDKDARLERCRFWRDVQVHQLGRRYGFMPGWTQAELDDIRDRAQHRTATLACSLDGEQTTEAADG